MDFCVLDPTRSVRSRISDPPHFLQSGCDILWQLAASHKGLNGIANRNVPLGKLSCARKESFLKLRPFDQQLAHLVNRTFLANTT